MCFHLSGSTYLAEKGDGFAFTLHRFIVMIDNVKAAKNIVYQGQKPWQFGHSLRWF